MGLDWGRKSRWFFRSLWRAYERWSKCDCVDLSAAFAYYTLQSFFPILLISLSVASWFLGKQQGLDQQIIALAAQVLPPSVVGLVDSTLVKLVNQGFGAGILGAMFLMITAGNAYLTLQRGADRLWEDVLPVKSFFCSSISWFFNGNRSNQCKYSYDPWRSIRRTSKQHTLD